MRKLLGILLGGLAAANASAQVVINEVDYDQVGTDSGEYVELKNMSGGVVNLDNYTVQLVNGNAGGAAVYDTIDLPNVNLAAGAYYVICANNTTVLNCDLDDGPDTDFIQNGSPDAIGLRLSGVLVDAVSYEGNTGAPYFETAGTPVATGSDSNTLANLGLSRFADGADTNDNSVDFTLRCITPGTANVAASASCPTPVPTPPAFSINSPAAVSEGTGAGTTTVTFTVTLSAQPPAGSPASVDFTTNSGTAISGTDFTANSGTLTFTNGGALTQTVDVDITRDNLAEAFEDFTVALSTPLNATIAAGQGTGTGGIFNDDLAIPVVADYFDPEGNSGPTAFVIDVNLSNPADTVRTFYVYTTDGSAVAPGDFTAIAPSATNTVTFPPMSTLQTVTVQVNGDQVIEADESFTITVSDFLPPPPPGVRSGATDTAIVTILNDDVPTVTIGNVSQAEGSPSGTTTFTFTATLSETLAQSPCDFSIETIDPGPPNNATPGVDYVAETNLAVSIPPNTLSQTFNITVNRDAVVEPNEVFQVSAYGEPFECNIQNADATGTILDDDTVALTLSIAGAGLVTEGTGPGTTNALFAVTVSGDPSPGSPVTVNYATQDGSALSASDYTSTTGTLTFVSSGPLTQNITVPITRDNVYEGSNEAFTATLSGANNATVYTSIGSATIVDDDSPPTPSIANLSQNEGNAGNTAFTFTVTLSNPSAFTSNFSASTTDGSAVAPGDYVTISQPVSFAPGETSKPVVVQVVGDTTVEPNETFTLQVSNSNSAEKGNASATGTILNDDVAIPTLVIDDITTVEGTGAGTTTGTFTVTLSAQPVVGSPVMVNYVSLDVSAVSPADFGAVSGTLTFTNGGPLTQSIPVTIVRDNLDELDEAYSVLLSGASNATIADAKGDAIIQDDDTATPSIADISQNEGNSGNTAFTFTVTLSNPSALALDFSVSTSNGSAIAPGDYTAVTAQPVSFTAGQTSQPVTVQVVGDGLVEANETFTLAIFQGAGVIDRGIQPIDTAVATILNDDVALDLSINDSSLVEGTGPGTSNATFTVTLSGQPLAGTPVTVNYAMANGSALAVTDYTAASGTLTFANGGALSQTITVALTRDNIDENDESYFVNLSNATNATIYDSQGAGTIVDDDTASLSIDDVTLPEGNGGGMTAFVFTVTTSNPSATAISVNYATSDGSAGSPSDFAPITGGIIIPALATSTTVTVNVVADDLAEPTETFTVNLFGAIGAVIADGQAIGTILGDEPSVPVTALDQAGLLLLGLLLLSVGAVVARRRD